MNINRNNYEEYFLLYADNELSKAERKMVEVFVNENPDLKEEFCMLKLTINLPDDEIKLNDKLFLYKNENSFAINENNYEEVFVLYNDNELSQKEQRETENFVAQHANLKLEFELIAKAKFTPDTLIVYPDKKELYRKEKSGRVVSIMVWRYAVAAVLIGFGLWFSIPYFSNQASQVPVTVQNIPIKKPKATTPDIIHVEPKKETAQIASSAVNKEKKDFSNGHHKIDKQIQKSSNNVAVEKSDVKTEASSLTKRIQHLKNEPVDVVALKTPIENNQENADNPKKPIEDAAKTSIQKAVQPVQLNYTQTAAYTETSSDNDNYVFYDVPAEQFNKTKVGGFLKKVKRIVERTNPISRLLKGNEEQVVANKL
jgi:hypothetical protein